MRTDPVLKSYFNKANEHAIGRIDGLNGIP